MQIRYVRSDSWWCAQIVDHPAAVSQGRTIKAAKANVLAALRDLRADG